MRCFLTPSASTRKCCVYFSINQQPSYCDPDVNLAIYIKIKGSKEKARLYLMDLLLQNEIPTPDEGLITLDWSIDGVDFLDEDPPPSVNNDPLQSISDDHDEASAELSSSNSETNAFAFMRKINEIPGHKKPNNPTPKSRNIPNSAKSQDKSLRCVSPSSSNICKTKKKKVASPFWKFFIQTTTGGTCKLCSQAVASAKCTTNLGCHLRRKHPEAYKNFINTDCDNNEIEGSDIETVDLTTQTLKTTPSANVSRVVKSSSNQASVMTKSSQPRIDSSFKYITSFNDGGSKASDITNAIIYMIVKDNLPFSMTEKEGFKSLLKIMVPLYKPPGRQIITEMIENKYEALKLITQSKLNEINSLTLTADVWTETMTCRSFLGCTVHFRVQNKISWLFLDLIQLEWDHSAKNISKEIEDILSSWNISKEKVIAVVTDSGSNMIKSINDTFGADKHIRCNAHIINLIVEDMITSVKPLDQIIKKVRAITLFFKSPLAAASLRKIQEKKDFLRCVLDVSTRWNSTFYMLQRFLRIKEDLSAALLQFSNSPPMLTAFEIAQVVELEALLLPFEKTTKSISGEDYVTSGRMLFAVNYLKARVTEAPSSTDLTQMVKRQLLLNIDKRFGSLDKQPVFAIASLLDPRFKRKEFNSLTSAADAIDKVNKLINKKENNRNKKVTCDKEDIIEKLEQTDDMWKYYQETLKKNPQVNRREACRTLDLDLKRYLEKDLEPEIIDPIDYWLRAEPHFPTLASIALNYLSVISTSVPCERMFSNASNIITAIRSRMSSDHLKQLLFLKSLEISTWNVK